MAPFLVRVFEALSVRKRRRDLPALREIIASGPETRILDVGGGGGSMTSLYSAGCREAVVLEPNSKKIAFGRKRHPQLTFVEGHAERIPFPDASFDRAVAIVSFHHTEDPSQSLREIRRVLRPDGRLVFFELRSEEHGRVGPRFIGRRMHGSDPHFYAPAELRDLLAAHGFREVTVRDGIHGYFVAATR